MLLKRLIREGKNGGKFQPLADADSETGRKASVDLYGKAIRIFCKDDSRDELINKFAETFHRVALASKALEIALGGDFNSDTFAVDLLLEELATMKEKVHARALSGAAIRAAKFKILETETIRLYEAGKWESAPAAALEITPKIVAMSKNGNGDLMATTTKPLEWIRAHNKRKKSNPS
jgi:hypothetical protein